MIFISLNFFFFLFLFFLLLCSDRLCLAVKYTLICKIFTYKLEGIHLFGFGSPHSGHYNGIAADSNCFWSHHLKIIIIEQAFVVKYAVWNIFLCCCRFYCCFLLLDCLNWIYYYNVEVAKAPLHNIIK